MKALLSLLTLSLVASAASADAIDDLIRTQREQRRAPGLSVAVVRDGKLVKQAGYGLANVELGAAAGPDTLYQLASVTKQFTATAVLMLWEEGKLGIDDPVRRHLPDLPEAWAPVTVRHLLSHTGGLPNYTDLPDFFTRPKQTYTPRELVDLVATKPLEFAPGSQWNYSNTGYIVLGMLLEKVSGKGYGALLQERIFGPLGMRATRVNDLGVTLPGRAAGYATTETAWRNVPPVDPSQPYAAGALVSTAADMARWMEALDAGKLLKAQTWALAWSRVGLAGGKSAGYGLGWEVGERNGRRRIGHNGGIPGFSTAMARFPDDKLSIVVLANGEGADSEAIVHQIAGAYVPALATRTEAVADPEPAVTALVKETIATLGQGKLDPSRFTAEFAALLTPERVAGGAKALAQFGAMGEMALVGRSVKDGVRRLELRALFGKTAVRFQAAVDPSGKISGLGFRPE